MVNDGLLIPTAVTTGASNGMKTEVTGGISDGTVVAVDYTAVMPAGIKPNDEQSPFAPQPPGRNKKK